MTIIQKKTSEEEDGKKWPDRINGLLLLSSRVNLNELVETACYDLRPKGLHLYWEKLQAKKPGTFLCFLGIPDALNLDKLVVLTMRFLKEAEEILMNK